MTSIAATINGATNGASLATQYGVSSNQQSVSQADFLKLMTAQMSAQDPFDPLDQTAMLGQLAQFSQVAGTAEMNVSMTELLQHVRAQGQLLADIRDRLAAPATTPDTPPVTGA